MGLGGDGTIRYGKIYIEKMLISCINLKLTYDWCFCRVNDLHSDLKIEVGKLDAHTLTW